MNYSASTQDPQPASHDQQSLFLSRLRLDPRDRAAQRDLADPVQLHRSILHAFPPLPPRADFRRHYGVLYRLDIDARTGAATVLVQSSHPPDWSFLERRAGYLAAPPECKPVATPSPCTRNWWLFPPRTREVQFDEKWAFVGKKEEHCDPQEPADARQGDAWDHVALDPESRLVVSVVPGKRTVANTEKLVADFKRRTGGRMMNLITSDEYKPYKKAILKAYGRRVGPQRRQGSRGRPRLERLEEPPALRYATVHKTRHKGAGDQGRTAGGLRHRPGDRAGLGRLRGQLDDQHGLCRAPQRDRPPSQCTQGAQDVSFFEGLGDA